MSDPCPRCGGRMRRHRVRHIGDLTTARRDCRCGHADKIIEQPAKILSVQVVRRRTNAPNESPNPPLQ